MGCMKGGFIAMAAMGDPNASIPTPHHNDYAPKMEVDAQTYAVRADGLLLTCEPAVSLPMTQRYFLF